MPSTPLPNVSAEPGRSRVVIARDARVRSTGTGFESGPLAQLLDRALQASFDSDSPIEAWKKVVRPGEVVGLKVNCLGGRGNATHPELVEAIIGAPAASGDYRDRHLGPAELRSGARPLQDRRARSGSPMFWQRRVGF